MRILKLQEDIPNSTWTLNHDDGDSVNRIALCGYIIFSKFVLTYLILHASRYNSRLAIVHITFSIKANMLSQMNKPELYSDDSQVTKYKLNRD